MKFGVLHLFESPMGRDDREMVNEQISLMQAAEAYDFDSIWPAEHHFSEYGVCASPAVTLAALASQTERIRLGTGVVVLPLHHPVRVAEEFALLDILSGGRVELGLGRGYQPAEFRGYGVDQTRSRELFDESLEVILRAWRNERLSFHGTHYHFEDVPVRPRPVQVPHPPVWMAALSEESFEKAGRLGLNLLFSPVFGGSLQVAADQFKRYRDALDRAGYDPETREVGALVMVYAGRTQEQAREEFAPSVHWYLRTYSERVAPHVGEPAIKGYENYTLLRDVTKVLQWDQLLQVGAAICGEVDYVTERIAEIGERVGVSTLLCWTRMGGLPTELVLAHMGAMRDHVMPALR
ncbi:MAG: LLM class flavin-dependent oxidoreductase [Myxococcota bacterium]